MNNIENITAVRDFMIQIGPEHFDMGSWFTVLVDDYALEDAYQFNINACGNTASIVGCAALKSGLRSTEQITEWLELENDGLFYRCLWHHLGPIGEEAKNMSDYEGALHLLNAAIEGKVVL